jgi:hypothetical protein
MSRRRPATPAKEIINDTIVVQSNGVLPPASQVHPAAAPEQGVAEAKLLAYINDERHFSFVR